MRLVRSAAVLLAGAILLVLPGLGRAGDTSAPRGFQPASPAHPVGVLLPVPWSRSEQTQGGSAARHLREGIFRSADGTTVVVPGKPDDSDLVERISSDDPETRMPPPKHGERLKPDQIELIKRWVTEGAEWKGHWAYLPPSRPRAPASKTGRDASGEIDRFVQAGILANGLEASPTGDNRTLIRRLSFDLIGLPPQPGEVAQFESDKTGYAYEHLVDRLLASPHFGERMAIFWLDYRAIRRHPPGTTATTTSTSTCFATT